MLELNSVIQLDLKRYTICINHALVGPNWIGSLLSFGFASRVIIAIRCKLARMGGDVNNGENGGVKQRAIQMSATMGNYGGGP